MDFNCDRIQCINLINRTDKKLHVEKELKPYNINVEFYPAIKNFISPAKGCFQSHINIINNAYNNNINRLMIFEDDIHIHYNEKLIKEINKFLDSNNTWEIFFLGGVPYIYNEIVTPVKFYTHIYKGHYFAAHAYIVNRKGMKNLKDAKWGKIRSVDLDLLKNNMNSYSVIPHLITQLPLKNDIGKNSITFLKARNMGLKFILWYATNINIKVPNLITMSITVLIIIISIIFTICKKNYIYFF